ncbi:LytTR family DNA-binding domain-containing protein [Sphingobacterium sp.]|uniref:LytR/AlgR family response regulator transcription factor n=1 Tax=Sphingobacterium sp. TaxID=341027 RepID=UPI00289A78C1|nr:LytTR family DNA-binding domain-containing protein [Sphingobacterium sp.]
MIFKNPIGKYPRCVISRIASMGETLTYAILLGLSSYLFLIVFQPFGTYNFDNAYKFWLLSGYGIIFAFAYTSVSILLYKKQWTIGAELLRISLVYLLACFLNFFYHSYMINHGLLQWGNLPYIGLYTLSLYVPIGSIYFLLRIDRHRLQETKNLVPAEEISLVAQQEVKEKNNGCLNVVNIPNGNQTFTLPHNDFIFAKSMDNYCMIYYRKEDTVEKQMVRITLARLDQLLNTGTVVRCHRSYLVNLEKIIKKEGNTQGLLLRFADTEDCALVSRSAVGTVKSYLLQARL